MPCARNSVGAVRDLPARDASLMVVRAALIFFRRLYRFARDGDTMPRNTIKTDNQQ